MRGRRAAASDVDACNDYVCCGQMSAQAAGGEDGAAAREQHAVHTDARMPRRPPSARGAQQETVHAVVMPHALSLFQHTCALVAAAGRAAVVRLKRCTRAANIRAERHKVKPGNTDLEFVDL